MATGSKRPRLQGILINMAAFVVIVAGMRAASSLIVQFLLAVFIAVVVTPLFIGMQRRGMPAPLAFLVLILGLIIISVFGVSVVGRSLNEFARHLPAYHDRLQSHVFTLVQWIEGKGVDVADDVIARILDIKNVMKVVGNTVSALTALLGKAFVILLIVIFILFEAAILPRKIRALPGQTDESWARLQLVLDHFRLYMGMKTLISLLTGFLITVMLFAFGVDYALLLGILAFVLNYVPNIGSIMAAIPGILLALVEFGAGRMLIIAIGYLVINVLIGNFLEPRVMGKGLGLSPMVIVVSLIFWGWVLGPIGMLLSVPLTMTAKIALESIEETQGIAMLLGSAVPGGKHDPHEG